jgi:hypothetical protein
MIISNAEMLQEQKNLRRPVTPIEEFAYLTCMSTSKARQLARDGKIVTCKIGKRLLVRTDSTIDGQINPRDVAALVGRQEQSRCCNFVRMPNTSKRSG